MTISCGAARRVLWPDGGPREASSEVVEAWAHVSDCADCEAFFVDMNAGATILRRAVGQDAAPLEVRQRLFAAIAKAHSQSPLRRRAMRPVIATTMAAALLLAATFTLRQFKSAASEQSLIAAIVSDHGQWLRGGGINSPVQGDVARWLAARVPFVVDVPTFPEANLKGGRITTIKGAQVAAVEYDLDGNALSYFVLPLDESVSGERIEQLMHSQREGYEIVMWREPGLLHVLVGRIPKSTLDELALMCIEQNRKVAT